MIQLIYRWNSIFLMGANTMEKCPDCGSELSFGATVCSACGAKQVVQNYKDIKKCVVCGKEHSEAGVLCYKCVLESESSRNDKLQFTNNNQINDKQGGKSLLYLMSAVLFGITIWKAYDYFYSITTGWGGAFSEQYLLIAIICALAGIGILYFANKSK